MPTVCLDFPRANIHAEKVDCLSLGSAPANIFIICTKATRQRMANFFTVEFLPIIAITIFGFVLTFNSTRRYIKWFFAIVPVLAVATGLYAEYRCDRSLTNIAVRMAKGVETCPLDPGANDTSQQNLSIILAQAWFIISQKTPGGSGKAAALEVLARNNEPLQGIDISCLLMGSDHDPSRRRYPCATLTQLDGLDLSGTPDLDMSKVNFEGIQGEGINLSRQDLTLSNLSFSHIPNSNFESAELWGANLSGSEVFSTRFENADLRGAQFVDSNISSSNFSGANLSSAKMMKSNAFQTDFTNANLRDAAFELAEIRYAIFDGANLFRSSFRDAKIVQTSFNGAQLSSADFTGAEIEIQGEVSSRFQGAWAWRNEEPKGLGNLARFVTLCGFDANIHDIRKRPSNC